MLVRNPSPFLFDKLINRLINIILKFQMTLQWCNSSYSCLESTQFDLNCKILKCNNLSDLVCNRESCDIIEIKPIINCINVKCHFNSTTTTTTTSTMSTTSWKTTTGNKINKDTHFCILISKFVFRNSSNR